jgi:hypothetical protein
MPVDAQTHAEAQYETTTRSYDLDTIGVEFEYPVAPMDGHPAGRADRSTPLRDEVGIGNRWDVSDYLEDGAAQAGNMTRDHVGAEITSAQMDLHSAEPSLWYAGTVERATEMGYPFAETGYGDTVFGMHLHLSDMDEHRAERLLEMSCEPWFRLFVNSSISRSSLDPWRHGGVNSGNLNGNPQLDTPSRQRIVNPRRGSGHYEWRLPEPVCVDHFIVLMNFLKRLSAEGPVEARQYAHELVHNRDPRLTCVRHYDSLVDEYGTDWVGEALASDNNTDREAAETAYEILRQDE